MGPWPEPSRLGICDGPSSFMFFIKPASLSLFKLDIWVYIMGLHAYYFKLNQYFYYAIIFFVTNLKRLVIFLELNIIYLKKMNNIKIFKKTCNLVTFLSKKLF